MSAAMSTARGACQSIAEDLLQPLFTLLLFTHWVLFALDAALEGRLFGGLSLLAIQVLLLHHALTLVGVGLLKLHRRLLAWPLWLMWRGLRRQRPALYRAASKRSANALRLAAGHARRRCEHIARQL